ncbi:Alkylglycerol monooxygenase [Geodia barretti]|uniref:Alkylglycerol monooxygenase n=1 Tax=Geodia barretti TaxID=519541 RepID=A0AA35TVT3_GEOBA|nr:Alkylglycerol monooxygenase [Geodia barretti]
MENVTTLTAARLAGKMMREVRPLFYLELPSTSSFQHVTEVPDYSKQVTPYFFAMIFLEVFIRWMKGMPRVRFNSSIDSLSAGLFLLLTKVLMGSIDISLYVWVHSRFCMYELPWDSALTWIVALLGVDCGYYWFHRMAHEVNLIWAAHQVHHSSDDFTLSSALRQPISTVFFSMFVYLPLALFLPPSLYFTHKQFNLLYQFWIHTEVVDRLGVLEWVLNTPSHHRVHHGRNPYCIDCNYAGVLIIWDRMFGTFQPELREEKVVYGLVHPLSSWNPFWAQVRNQGSLQSSFPLRDPRYTTMYTSRGDWCGGRKEMASHSNCSSFSKVPAGRQGNHASVFDKIFLRFLQMKNHMIQRCRSG